jgi:hypothetical protein
MRTPHSKCCQQSESILRQLGYRVGPGSYFRQSMPPHVWLDYSEVL